MLVSERHSTASARRQEHSSILADLEHSTTRGKFPDVKYTAVIRTVVQYNITAVGGNGQMTICLWVSLQSVKGKARFQVPDL